MSQSSFLWHDYETFGTDPAFDRPVQFACLRTDTRLEPLGEPLVLHCKPADDLLPHPGACLVTGITPQAAARQGVVEADFARAIHAELAQPHTCGVGYNSLRFDDEVTRHLFWRNFLDPYAREWRDGNSRFDLIALARMCYALRPDGMKWPERESGVPSFRLEDLTAANGIGHADAHDALADVHATLELARRLRGAQPRLWDWALSLRETRTAYGLLDPRQPTPVLHTSGRYPAQRGCTTLVLPLAAHPERKHSVIVYDLMADPSGLLELDAGAIADRVFTPTADLPEGLERIPLKAVHANRVPMLAPQEVLRGADPARIGLDPGRCQRHAEMLLPQLALLRTRVQEVFATPARSEDGEPESMLYAGGFLSEADRKLVQRVSATPPQRLGEGDWRFSDPRLPTLLFRYRARNWPELLDAAEAARWEADRRQRLTEPRSERQFSLAGFRAELAESRSQREGDGAAQRLLDELEAWVRDLHLGGD